MVLLGSGAAVSFPASMTLPTSDADASEAGLASGLVNTTLQVGGAPGLAVVTTLSRHTAAPCSNRAPPPTRARTGGYHLARLIGASSRCRRQALTLLRGGSTAAGA